MRTFELKYNEPGTLFMSPFQQENDKVQILATKAEKWIDNNGTPPVVKLSPGSLRATQWWIDDIFGGGDPVFPKLEDHPVVVQTAPNQMHIIDGHHRTHKAVKNNDSYIEVYLIDLNK